MTRRQTTLDDSMADVAAPPEPRADALQRILDEIKRLGLSEQVLEIETRGYTTLRGALQPSQVERAKRAIVARVERDLGKRIDIDAESGANVQGVNYIPYLLYDDAVFEEILMEPKPLALVTYLLGESCLLSSIGCHFKGPGGAALPLHSDNGNGMPAPFPAFSQVANVNYALTPYSREAGALAMVPGSHKLARQPNVTEMQLDGERTNKHAIAMDLAPGDAVVWHGNTWHGSFARRVPGIRMNLAVYFNRQYVQTQERHREAVPPDVLARHANDPRFRTLLGDKQPYGWRHEGPDYSVMARNPRGLYD
jgi:ectoine hydroxylase-related dioxygenase (phytanoyl-CoA dioxygenase family)